MALYRPATIKLLWGNRGTIWLHSEASMALERTSQIFLDGSCCTEKPDPGDIDGYWVEPDEAVYERIDPYWIDFELLPVPHLRMSKWRMWVENGVEFFVHPAMQAGPELGFPEFFRRDRDGRARGLIQVVKAQES